jgi:hypothetical protein
MELCIENISEQLVIEEILTENRVNKLSIGEKELLKGNIYDGFTKLCYKIMLLMIILTQPAVRKIMLIQDVA